MGPRVDSGGRSLLIDFQSLRMLEPDGSTAAAAG